MEEIKDGRRKMEDGSGCTSRISTYAIIFVLLLGLYSCEVPVDWQFKPEENGALVVEAIITNEFKIQEIKLSLSYNELNGKPTTISDAIIHLSDGPNQVRFIESIDEKGKYKSEIAFAAQLYKIYSLDIQYNENTYQAQNEMQAILPLNTLQFNSIGETDSLSIGEVGPLFNPNEQAMYEIDVDWSHLNGIDSSHVKLFFYSLATIDVNELFKPESENIVFPRGSIVIEKKYSLNPEFAAYIRALLMETEWQGGVFDEDSGSLPTNISNGGLGFFGVSAVLIDTLVAE